MRFYLIQYNIIQTKLFPSYNISILSLKFHSASDIEILWDYYTKYPLKETQTLWTVLNHKWTNPVRHEIYCHLSKFSLVMLLSGYIT